MKNETRTSAEPALICKLIELISLANLTRLTRPSSNLAAT